MKFTLYPINYSDEIKEQYVHQFRSCVIGIECVSLNDSDYIYHYEEVFKSFLGYTPDFSSTTIDEFTKCVNFVKKNTFLDYAIERFFVSAQNYKCAVKYTRKSVYENTYRSSNGVASDDTVSYYSGVFIETYYTIDEKIYENIDFIFNGDYNYIVSGDFTLYIRKDEFYDAIMNFIQSF